MENRIFDRQNYSQKTIENFEIMSAYYVDIFYNHLYTEAKKLKVSGSVSSITEGYKHTLNAFLMGLTNPKLYKKSIIGMHHYFITIGFASISFSACVDKLTNEFVPSDYYNSLTSTQKMGVLRMIINQSIKNFIKKIVDEHMSKIMDNHSEKDNVRILQDDFIDCLIMEREGMYQRFIATQTKTNKNETVNRLLAEKMQNEIKRLVKEKYEQQKQIAILKKAYSIKKQSENKLLETLNELKQKISSLQSNSNSQSRSHYSPRSNESSSDDESPIMSLNTQQAQSMRQPEQKTQPVQQYQPMRQPEQKTQPVQQAQPMRQPEQKMQPEQKTQQAQPILPPIKQDDSDSDSESENSGFIQVNKNNINNILEVDNEILQNMKDSDLFNTEMEEGTTLSDFM